ncbi:hypothetical protein ALC57_12577 [Trachymyrmex cornetzi]|uniref:Integrase catalytic domain-containing protein n=1 Tax=Trachymyrmex cornetzi TaxID=471704 RepID=A0A151J0U3_9HYME|nr:hypothetical protein ALC57_12577 [Trachymyrmex cornetzi]
MSEKRLLVNELHAPARRNFSRRHVIVHGYDDLWQADMIEMHPYTRFNRGYHYILTVIDVLSKHAWAVPLKAKCQRNLFQNCLILIRSSVKLKRSMKGRRFATIEKIKAASLEELKAIPKSAFQKCFDDWKKRWHKCIVSEGDYFEGDNINLDE